jgi:hypothetical protein
MRNTRSHYLLVCGLTLLSIALTTIVLFASQPAPAQAQNQSTPCGQTPVRAAPTFNPHSPIVAPPRATSSPMNGLADPCATPSLTPSMTSIITASPTQRAQMAVLTTTPQTETGTPVVEPVLYTDFTAFFRLIELLFAELPSPPAPSPAERERGN